MVKDSYVGAKGLHKAMTFKKKTGDDD